MGEAAIRTMMTISGRRDDRAGDGPYLATVAAPRAAGWRSGATTA
jgi:hypothetical protein